MSAPRVVSVTPHVFRWPVAEPVRTSFGVMHDRPMLLVEVRFEDGSALYRQLLSTLRTKFLSLDFETPASLAAVMAARTFSILCAPLRGISLMGIIGSGRCPSFCLK